jgi:hypothetical protein
MNPKIRHLKIKIKNLADESRTIREEEMQTSGQEKWDLQHHRKTVVRRAARKNLLAYGYLRGIPYKLMEPKTYTPDWAMEQLLKEVEKLAVRFGGEGEEPFRQWVAGPVKLYPPLTQKAS